MNQLLNRFVKLASATSFSSTPNLSTIIAFTLDAMSDIIFNFNLICWQNKNFILKQHFVTKWITTKLKKYSQRLFYFLPIIFDQFFCWV